MSELSTVDLSPATNVFIDRIGVMLKAAEEDRASRGEYSAKRPFIWENNTLWAEVSAEPGYYEGDYLLRLKFSGVNATKFLQEYNSELAQVIRTALESEGWEPRRKNTEFKLESDHLYVLVQRSRASGE